MGKEGQNAPQIRAAVEARVKDRSPFLWVEAEDPAAPFQWADGVAGPVKAALLLARSEEGVPVAVRAHLELATVANLRICLETILTKDLRNGDTGLELRESALVSATEKALLEAVEEGPDLSRADLRLKVRDLWPEAVKELWNFHHAGRKHVATRYRGRLDRLFSSFLSRSNFFQLPPVEVAGTTDQTFVAGCVLAHLRARGWSVLSGCGGAGKSFVLGQIAKVLLRSRVPNEHQRALDCPVCDGVLCRNNCSCGFVRPTGAQRRVNVLFAAPTNRAVAVLQRAVLDAVQDTREADGMVADTAGPVIGCCTLHALSCMRHESPVDLLVLDESSMLSSEHGDIIMHCAALRHAALLLVGDDLQLPPVGSGELFRPLLQNAGLPCLSKNLRAQGNLQEPIAAIRKGQASQASGFAVVVAKDADRHTRIFEEIARASQGGASCQVLALRNEDRVNYCCFAIKKHHSQPGDDYVAGKPNPFLFKPFVGEPVRFQKNTFKPQACRGSIGLITAVSEEVMQENDPDKPPRKAYTISVTVGKDIVQVKSSAGGLGFELRPAWAITVHDSQGGEFDEVHVLLPPSPTSPLCTLEMLYTASSRARRSLKIWCLARSFESYEEALARVSNLRATPFKAMLASARRERRGEEEATGAPSTGVLGR